MRKAFYAAKGRYRSFSDDSQIEFLGNKLLNRVEHMKTLQARNLPKSAQAGFTIIELIVVILLLGILTATALPRFLDVTDEAHAAVVSAVQGGLVTGGALFRAQFVANGEDTTTGISDFAGNFPNSNGYPLGTTDNTLDTNQDCADIYIGLLQEGRPGVIASTQAAGSDWVAGDFAASGGADFYAKLVASRTCEYAYIGQYATTSDVPVTNLLPALEFDLTSGAVIVATVD